MHPGGAYDRRKKQDTEANVYPKILLTAEQRQQFTSFPEVVTPQVLTGHFSLSEEDLVFVRKQPGSHNRLGIAIQLGTLRYLGYVLSNIPFVPRRVIDHVAAQLGVDPDAFARYGERVNTFYEHLERIRTAYGYRDFNWPAPLHIACQLLPTALHSDEALPLVEQALTHMRRQQIIAPGITTTERLVQRVQRLARWVVDRRLTTPLSNSQRTALDLLLELDVDIGMSALAWLRIKPSNPGMAHLLKRIRFLRALKLPDLPQNVDGNRSRQLAMRCRHYPPQPLAHFSSDQRRALLFVYLIHLELEFVDQ